MTVYVRIPRVNGRHEYYDMVVRLNETGILTAEYHNGGWGDYVVGTIAPHLMFQDEEEAMMYVLKFGGEVSSIPPVIEPITPQ